jgi:hypothetical protein
VTGGDDTKNKKNKKKEKNNKYDNHLQKQLKENEEIDNKCSVERRLLNFIDFFQKKKKTFSPF